MFPETLRRTRGRVGLVLLVLVCFFQLSPAAAEGEKENDGAAALRKSLLYPGLGQLQEKQYLKGIVFMAAETACIIAAVHFNRKADQAYWQYRQADTTQQAVDMRRLTEKHDRRRNLVIAAGAAVWVLNLVDAWLHRNRRQRTAAKLSFAFNDNAGLTFGFTYTVN